MTILITGAAGGIGSACVRAAAANRQETVIACARDLTRVPTADNIAAVGGDLTDATTYRHITEVLEGQPLRAVIANHGITGAGALRTLTDDYISRVLLTNFATVTWLWRTVLPNLALTPSVFLVVASQAGLIGEASNVAYCASKFALLGWLRAMNRQRLDDVILRGLCPGATDTAMLRQAVQLALTTSPPEHAASVHRIDQIKVGRYGQPEEIAAAALYLADRRWHTPEVLAVTGGDVLL